jgi:hypothetical protein
MLQRRVAAGSALNSVLLNLDPIRIPVFLNSFLPIEAHVKTDCAGSCGGRLRTGLCFSFFLGLEIIKKVLKN